MSIRGRLHRRVSVVVVVVAGALLVPVAGASAAQYPKLDWQDCGDGFECATAKVPKDHGNKHAGTLSIDVIRKPATDPENRIGSLFTNPGGPGASGVEFVRAAAESLYATLNDRFDIVGWDPRGTGPNGLDCKLNQETEGLYAQPFVTPENIADVDWVGWARNLVNKCVARNAAALPYVSTANTARDLDLLRGAVGDDKLYYLGFSYGTFLGATYESLFPRRVGRLVLDGALDADGYVNHPLKSLREQSAGFERALGRFFQACASDQAACLGFGGADPWNAYDELKDAMDANPLPAPQSSDPRPVTGDDLNAIAILLIYAKQNWPLFAETLALTQAGDGSLVRELVNIFNYRLDDGTFDPGGDRYFLLGAIEQRYPNDIGRYAKAGAHSWKLFDHFWWNAGYIELPYGLFPIEPRGVFYGPFKAPSNATPTLVVGTTYDPATPYRGSRLLVRQLGNARLLTMRGDGHTAYGGNSACIDAAVDAYLEEGTVPAVGATCAQEVPFAQAAAKAKSVRSVRSRLVLRGGRW